MEDKKYAEIGFLVVDLEEGLYPEYFKTKDHFYAVKKKIGYENLGYKDLHILPVYIKKPDGC